MQRNYWQYAVRINRGFWGLLWSISEALLASLAFLLPWPHQQWQFVVGCWFVLAMLASYGCWFGYRSSAQRLQGLWLLEHWAEQYLLQPLSVVPLRLNSALYQAIAKQEQTLLSAKSVIAKLDGRLRSTALQDSESQLGDRRYFDERLTVWLTEHGQTLPGTLVLIQFANQVLQLPDVWRLLKQTIEVSLTDFDEAIIARHAEQDLTLFIANMTATDAKRYAEFITLRLVTLLTQELAEDSHLFDIGVVSFTQAEDVYPLLAEADMALRSAQLHGQNSWFMYAPGTVSEHQAKGSVRWRTALNIALEHQHFLLHFQPLVTAAPEQVHHYEVFARMKDELGQLVPASVFVPMAYQCGLIKQLDEYIISRTIELLRFDRSVRNVKFSLNLHISSLLDVEFIQRLKTQLSEQQCGQNMIIEIKELHAVKHSHVLRESLSLLLPLGVELLVDQVGLFMVNTAYLNVLPVRYVKIDPSITQTLPNNVEHQLFLQSLLMMCNNFRIEVFATGVETALQWQTLQKLGVEAAQGHLFNHPTPDWMAFLPH